MIDSKRRGEKPAPPPEDSQPVTDEDTLFDADVERIGEDAPEENEDTTLSMLREFGKPPEWRTMAKNQPVMNHLAAAVLAKGDFLGSQLRRRYVENLFLMSRSNDGYGSEQMVRVATRSDKKKPNAVRRFFGLGPKEGGE